MYNTRILVLIVGFLAFLAVSFPVTNDLNSPSLALRSDDKTLLRTVTAAGAVAPQEVSGVIGLIDRATKPSKTKPSKTKPLKKPFTTPKAKVCTRADSAGCGKTAEYQIVAAAAKKKGNALKLGESYLLKVTRGVHKQIVIAKVVQNAQQELDIDAAMSELVKDVGSNSNTFIQTCKALHGAECEHQAREEYNCERALDGGAKFKFVGAAKPEYADKHKFISDSIIDRTVALPATYTTTGKNILEKDKKYNIIYNSCKLALCVQHERY